LVDHKLRYNADIDSMKSHNANLLSGKTATVNKLCTEIDKEVEEKNMNLNIYNDQNVLKNDLENKVSGLNMQLITTTNDFNTYKKDSEMNIKLLEAQKMQRDSAINDINNKLYEIDQIYAANRMDLERKLGDLNKDLEDKQMELASTQLKNKDAECQLSYIQLEKNKVNEKYVSLNNL